MCALPLSLVHKCIPTGGLIDDRSEEGFDCRGRSAMGGGMGKKGAASAVRRAHLPVESREKVGCESRIHYHITIIILTNICVMEGKRKEQAPTRPPTNTHIQMITIRE